MANLEDKNREYKRELDQARAELRSKSPKTVRHANAAMPSKGPASPVIAAQPQPGRTGLFWATSAGGVGGWTFGRFEAHNVTNNPF
ncbi:hypothetical protein [Bradyrhizobium japonicum]|uniref:hypothetical protein n=1 Tax=Bradyrhizobium japonicum TaxID=375 RepID=UPI0004BA7DFB|nr:hypothetical protein [Bradyrhizobium japonicum]